MRASLLAVTLVLLLGGLVAAPPVEATHVCTLPTSACDDPPFGVALLCKVAPSLFHCRR